MAKFKDSQGREWTLHIDLLSILMLREQCDPDFLKNETPENNTYKRLDADPVLRCRVIYLLCKEQIESLAGITRDEPPDSEKRAQSEKDFYMHVIGDALQAAIDALLEATVSFIPRRTERELLQASAAVDQQLRETATARALAKVTDPALRERVEGMIESEVDAAVERVLTRLSSATSSPDS